MCSSGDLASYLHGLWNKKKYVIAIEPINCKNKSIESMNVAKMDSTMRVDHIEVHIEVSMNHACTIMHWFWYRQYKFIISFRQSVLL